MFNVPNSELPRGTPPLAAFIGEERWSENGQVQETINEVPIRCGAEFLSPVSQDWWHDRWRTIPDAPENVPQHLRPTWSLPFDTNPSGFEQAAAAPRASRDTQEDLDSEEVRGNNPNVRSCLLQYYIRLSNCQDFLYKIINSHPPTSYEFTATPRST